MVELYTDGACSPNPGTGGWGAYFKFNDIAYKEYGYKLDTTNNFMELTAIVEGLKKVKAICPSEDVKVYSDSQYVVSTITKHWKISKNVELWQEAMELIKSFNDIEFEWVKGHSTSLYNNIVDELAVQARTRLISSKVVKV